MTLPSLIPRFWPAQTVRPEPFHRTPNNLLGYITGLFFRIPSAIDGTYKHMRLTWGLSGALERGSDEAPSSL